MTHTISRKAHGIMDYVFSALIIASPWLFGFTNEAINLRIAVFLGGAMAAYSFCTEYELGVFRSLPFSANLFLDMLVGVFLGSAFMHISMGSRGGLVFFILGLLVLIDVFHTARPVNTSTS